MIFYATALSSYSAKVRIVLCAKGITFEETLPPGGYHSVEYRAIVSMGTLPAIQIGDWVLSESEAINEYLEEAHPDPALLPRDPRERARVRFIGRFHDLHLEPRVRSLFAHVKPAARRAAHVTAQRLEIERCLDQLAQWVQPQPYLLTPELSLADCGLLVTLPLARDVLAACGEPLGIPPSLQRWLHTASQHQAVVRALLPWRKATQHWLQA